MLYKHTKSYVYSKYNKIYSILFYKTTFAGTKHTLCLH